ncbi:DUF5034 domain-containing protein [Niabella pedocola]|uniref:DUF5034 domain-containing protein n=1 Tax=Niabella pedocola TaxID=1752077 RepID=A0ABS8PWU3_9BACT|nr:DUF5034 domain-containing protein [Niabella pedocola]MCD2425534.1 DUF5034 domain-containing protein [Niabella pedocola]
MSCRIYFKGAILLMLPYIFTVFAGCVCNVNTLYYRYDFNMLELRHLQGAKPIGENAGASIHKNAYGIEAKLTAITTLAKTEGTNGWVLWNTAHAMTKVQCRYSEYMPVDSIRSIVITDYLQETGGGWSSGTDVSSRFRIYNGGYVTVADYLKYWPYPNYNDSKKMDVSLVEKYLLMEPLPDNGWHKFKMAFTMKSGSIIEQTTAPVYLQ